MAGNSCQNCLEANTGQLKLFAQGHRLPVNVMESAEARFCSFTGPAKRKTPGSCLPGVSLVFQVFRDQKLRWARTFRNTVLWSLNSYTVVGLGEEAPPG
jgi:hypothetical protein